MYISFVSLTICILRKEFCCSMLANAKINMGKSFLLGDISPHLFTHSASLCCLEQNVNSDSKWWCFVYENTNEILLQSCSILLTLFNASPSSLQGPLPAFSAENSWSDEKTLNITKEEGGFGFTAKGSRPATVYKVDKGSPAKVRTVSGNMALSQLK